MKLFGIFLISTCLLLAEFAASADTGDSEVAVLTYLKLRPGTEVKFMASLNKIVKPSLAEPGNIAWYVQKSVTDPTNIVFYTRWRSEDALQSHLKSKPVADYIAETAALLAPGYPQLLRFHPIDQIRSESQWPPNCNNCSCCP